MHMHKTIIEIGLLLADKRRREFKRLDWYTNSGPACNQKDELGQLKSNPGTMKPTSPPNNEYCGRLSMVGSR